MYSRNNKNEVIHCMSYILYLSLQFTEMHQAQNKKMRKIELSYYSNVKSTKYLVILSILFFIAKYSRME